MVKFGETTEKREILIVIKTYPEISKKHTETVCTAGIDKESKQLIRLYPVRYRYLSGEKQFKKYQWIVANISKATTDIRPESYNIVESTIRLGEVIGPGRDWQEREKWVLSPGNVYGSFEDLIAAQQEGRISLGIIKPRKIKNFRIEKKRVQEIEDAKLKVNGVLSQLDMFEDRKKLYVMPYRFILEFVCDNAECKGHSLSILDWEFGQLYRKVRNTNGWERKIEKKIEEICGAGNDTYIFLGNMARWQNIFCILGFYYPPKIRQMALF